MLYFALILAFQEKSLLIVNRKYTRKVHHQLIGMLDRLLENITLPKTNLIVRQALLKES
jgi:hypothetical protein